MTGGTGRSAVPGAADSWGFSRALIPRFTAAVARFAAVDRQRSEQYRASRREGLNTTPQPGSAQQRGGGGGRRGVGMIRC